MLKKIIHIKNVGRFRNSATSPHPQLAKYVFVSGANGYGKSTICSVLRSLALNDVSHIAGRKTLGSREPIDVQLHFEGGISSCNGESWTHPVADIAIFDSVYVNQNVYAGESVEVDQKRGLYRVIVGTRGVSLATEESQLAVRSRNLTTEITTARKAVLPHCPPGMSVDDYVRLRPVPEIDTRITRQESLVRSAREASAVAARAPIASIPFPVAPLDLDKLLARTLDDVSADAEQQVNDQLSRHGMSAKDMTWLATGVEHSDDDCAFCGQSLEGIEIVQVYRAIFSGEYKALVQWIAAMREKLIGLFGDAATGRLDTLAEQNAAAVEFWAGHCSFEDSLVFPEEYRTAARTFGREAVELVKAKAAAPLDVPTIPESFTAAQLVFEESAARVAMLNRAIEAANSLVQIKKAEVAGTNLASAERELKTLLAVKARHGEPVASLCKSYAEKVEEKTRVDARKTAVRQQLDDHIEGVVEPYEKRINELLDDFNAEFRIAKVSHAFPGGVATSSYQLIINNQPVDLGDSKTPLSRPSFRNTLSAGDKSTLALAFFIASLEQDPDLARKIVVFDDPFTSQDSYRRLKTKFSILAVAGKARQMILLSHDMRFLKDVWERAPQAESVTLQITDERSAGSKLRPLDLNEASRGRNKESIDDLLAFHDHGVGKLLDVVLKVRQVCESHCWTTFKGAFDPGRDWLGTIAGKIRDGGAEHPAAELYVEIDQINDYTKEFYHGADPTGKGDEDIDPRELKGVVKRALRLINALQA